MTPRHTDPPPAPNWRLPEDLAPGDVLRVPRRAYRLRVEEVGPITEDSVLGRCVNLQVRQLGPPGSPWDGRTRPLPVVCGIPVALEPDP